MIVPVFPILHKKYLRVPRDKQERRVYTFTNCSEDFIGLCFLFGSYYRLGVDVCREPKALIIPLEQILNQKEKYLDYTEMLEVLYD